MEDLKVIYSDFLYEGTYFVVDQKTYTSKMKENEQEEDYAVWREASPEVAEKIIQIYQKEGDEDYEVIESMFSEFYIAAVKPY